MKRALHAALESPDIEPLIPVPRADPFDDPAYLFEPKYDGVRGLLFVRGNGAWFQSRQGMVLPHFDDLASAVRAELPGRSAILDGEVIAIGTEGQEDVSAMCNGHGQLHYIVFDVLWHNGADQRPLPLWRRKQTLDRLVPDSATAVSRAYALPERGRRLFRAAQRLHFEGIVAKRWVDPYCEGSVWYAIRNRAYTHQRLGPLG